MYKEHCGFRKINVCSFKEEDCNKEKCDMFEIPFTSKAIREEIKKLEARIKEMAKEEITVKKVKQMVKEEKKEGQTEEVVEYKKKMLLLEDLGKGLEYLKKAYIYCKRTRK